MDKRVLPILIDHIAQNHKDQVAVEVAGQRITYAELQYSYNAIAGCLIDIEIKKGEIIGVYLPASLEYISAIVAVNKASGIFLPLSGQYPPNRISRVINKALPRIFITNEEGRDALLQIIGENYSIQNLRLIIVSDQVKELSVDNFCSGSLIMRSKMMAGAKAQWPVVDGNDSNYLIYTSGSTGEPKIIEGVHKSLSHFIHWEMNEFKCDHRTKVSLLAPVSFDVSFRDIFMPLAAGGTVCIPEQDIKTRSGHLLKWIYSSGITLMHMVPSLFRALIVHLEEYPEDAACLQPVKHILLAGEPLLTDDVNRWGKLNIPGIELVNLYGPSETTLAKIFNRLENKVYPSAAIVPLGSPISNTSVLILNKSNKICNIGEIGEIHIRSPFITNGYYKDPELTQSKFIQNPLHSDFTDIIYKTGDMGKYLEDATIGFTGRMDGQVKIRGNRVEIAEVELSIKQYEHINHVVVIPVVRANSETALACYYTVKKDFVEEKLVAHLKELLPVYMVPSYFVCLENLPLTINGKIDKTLLPSPEEMLYEKLHFKDPTNATETAVAFIWKEVLGLKKVGIHNSFFELGGHSLSATKTISQLYKQMGKEITLKEFFSHPTVAGLSKLLDEKHANIFQPIKKLDAQPYYDISYAQKRLWILYHTQQPRNIHNIPLAGIIKSDSDIGGLKKSLETIINRHESLRTTFLFNGGDIKQQIKQSATDIMELDESGAGLPEQTIIQKYLNRLTGQVFNLQQGPLLTIDIVKLPSHRYLLLVNMHHIISDGWSVGVFIHELAALYKAYSMNLPDPLPGLTVHYKDYVEWQNVLLENNSKALKEYWRQECAGPIPQINLPFDFPRPVQKSFRGKKHRFALSRDASDFLRKTGVETGSGLFNVMLTLIYSVLYRYSGQNDIIIGTPVSGRNHESLEQQIGFYLNYLVLRMNIRGDEQFIELLQAVKGKVLNAFEHQDYPYDQLVDDLVRDQPLNRNPFYDVLVVMNNEGLNGKKEDFDNLEKILGLEGIAIDDHLSKLDITFFIADLEQIMFTIEYSTDLFRAGTIEKMENCIHRLVAVIMEQKTSTIDELISHTGDETSMELQEGNMDMIDERF